MINIDEVRDYRSCFVKLCATKENDLLYMYNTNEIFNAIYNAFSLAEHFFMARQEIMGFETADKIKNLIL